MLLYSLKILKMENKKLIIVQVKGKVPSVNEYLLPGLIKKRKKNKSTGKYEVKQVPVLYKSPEASSYQKWIKKQLHSILKPDDLNEIRSWKWYKVTIQVVFNGGYMFRDADNILKLTIDALFNNFLGKDDRYINSITSEKYVDEGNEHEYLIITIEKSSDNRYKFGRHE